MTIDERFKAFFSTKRSWKWLVAGLAMVIVGHLLEGVPILSSLQRFTEWVAGNLRAVQPFAIADAFFDATRGHRGLWFCAPVGESGCGSVVGIANIGLASLFAIPRVAATIWRDDGMLATVLFGLTILAMALVIIGVWSDINKPDGGLGKALLGTVGTLALGPLAGGVVFWVLLKFLLLLTIMVGMVLAGIAWFIATFGLIYKIGALLFEAAEKGEGLEKKAALLMGRNEPPAS
jgi:hypothetical protein